MSEERTDYIAETLRDEEIEDSPTVEYRDPVKELGFAKVDHIITLDAGLSDGAYRTYALLHFYWQQKKLAWMGVATIAKARGVSGPTLKRHLKELQDAGLISRSRRMGHSSITYLEDLPERYEDAAKSILQSRSQKSRKLYQKRSVEGIKNDTTEEEQVEEEQVQQAKNPSLDLAEKTPPANITEVQEETPEIKPGTSSAAAEFDALPSASEGMEPREHTAAVADPQAERMEFIEEWQPKIAQLYRLDDDATTARSVAAKLYDHRTVKRKRRMLDDAIEAVRREGLPPSPYMFVPAIVAKLEIKRQRTVIKVSA